jgi:hypothetical protein
MATNMLFGINYVDADVNYVTTPADFIISDLVNDYLIWTSGNSVITDLMTHQPTTSELNAAATIIDPLSITTVPMCLLMDYSHDVGGSYYTHLVKGMSENKRYAFLFSFDNATATEPQLEAWDSSSHATFNKNVLGVGTAINSFVKAVCTTVVLPGAGWVGTSLAGASNVLLLNAGNGALTVAKDLYANLKIVIPTNYATPAAETFVFTVRYTYV